MQSLRFAYCTDGTCAQVAPGAYGTRITISASVGRGGRNVPSDVRTIQSALNEIDPLNGGPFPPLDVDGLIGPKTIGAIEHFQHTICGFEHPDGRVDPGHRTIHFLSSLVGLEVLKTLYAKIPEAVSWINAARRTLLHARLQVRPTFALGTQAIQLVNKYFHLDEFGEDQTLRSIARIDEVFRCMQECIAHRSAMTQIGTGYFQLEPTNYCERSTGPLASCVDGGYHLKGKDGKPAISTDYGQTDHYRMDAIYVCLRMRHASLERFTHIMVHELAHFVGPTIKELNRIRDYSYLHREHFFQLKAETAMKTADAYAGFAAEAKLKRELSRTKL